MSMDRCSGDMLHDAPPSFHLSARPGFAPLAQTSAWVFVLNSLLHTHKAVMSSEPSMYQRRPFPAN